MTDLTDDIDEARCGGSALNAGLGQWFVISETKPPAHTEILLYRVDAGIWQGEYTYCADWVSDEELEIEKYDDNTLFSMDYWYFDHRGAHRCEGDLSPTHWMPLPSPPNKY